MINMPCDSTEKIHPVFTNDPIQFQEFVYKEVKVKCKGKESHELVGWVHSVDPVSECISLVTFHDDTVDVTLVMGQCVGDVEVVNENTDTHRVALDQLFNRHTKSLSAEEQSLRRDKLMSWLQKNRIPVTNTGQRGDLISVSGAALIYPPYGPQDCNCANQIMLEKLQKLIQLTPDS